jgi:hypothetical protein
MRGAWFGVNVGKRGSGGCYLPCKAGNATRHRIYGHASLRNPRLGQRKRPHGVAHPHPGGCVGAEDSNRRHLKSPRQCARLAQWRRKGARAKNWILARTLVRAGEIEHIMAATNLMLANNPFTAILHLVGKFLRSVFDKREKYFWTTLAGC